MTIELISEMIYNSQQRLLELNSKEKDQLVLLQTALNSLLKKSELEKNCID